MLNINELKNQIQSAVETHLKPALEAGLRQSNPDSSEIMNTAAETFAQTTVDIFAEPFATALAGAIDYYVRSISISGTIVTTGSPVTQQALINSPSAVTNGFVPNSLGIN